MYSQSLEEFDTLDIFKDCEQAVFENNIGEDIESSTIKDELTALEESPLDLNEASSEELMQIPGVSSIIAARIVERRSILPFHSKRELLVIEGISNDLYKTMRSYVEVKKIRDSNKFFLISRASTDIEDRRGFITGEYPGSKFQVIHKMKSTHTFLKNSLFNPLSAIQVGAVTKRDPGEIHYIDFLSGFILLDIPSWSSNCLVGDYKINAGEGLIFWSSSAFSKGNNSILPTRKNGNGFKPNYSTDENSFFRGMVLSLGIKDLKFQLFYSNKPIHASLDSSGQITSIFQSGLFRTQNEREKKNATRESLIGYSSSIIVFNNLKFNFAGYLSHFLNSYLSKGIRNMYSSDIWMQGITCNYTNDRLDLFSEFAMDYNHLVATISGVTFEPSNIVSLTSVARKYPRGFQSIHGNAFGEMQGNNQNETGLYCGIRLHPVKSFIISAYVDQYKFPAPTKLIKEPSQGSDYLIFIEYPIQKSDVISFRFRKKESPTEINFIDTYGRIFQKLEHKKQENYRITNKISPTPTIQVKTKIEWTSVGYSEGKEHEKGILLSQSFKVKFYFTIHSQVTFFDTDSYESRLYDFEEDIPGVYSNPALFGRGIRWNGIIRYDFFEKCFITLKYSKTYKDAVYSIGSGLDEIIGNQKSHLSLQMNIQF
jgi:hypothetical protein